MVLTYPSSCSLYVLLALCNPVFQYSQTTKGATNLCTGPKGELQRKPDGQCITEAHFHHNPDGSSWLWQSQITLTQNARARQHISITIL